ncbi:hypothetical protein HN630_01790 [archaeon]|jgi:hypothetical protein|nr:hypothetical protein [archaeon]MBT3577833.1 hypothetical protein [archaeon]MBT6955785.1 hypothetical protein [archaeon]MBT7025295.1 hypothetical protein [archaeon]MBT7238480.1 hypothetical protein [archaeon]
MRRLNKKGAAHFEMIVSFVLFVGFIFFLLIFIRPYGTTTLSGSVVLTLFDSFEERAHTNLTRIFLKANNVGGGGCFYVNLPSEMFGYELTKSLVRGVDDNERNSKMVGEELSIDATDEFYKVAISPDFDNDVLPTCTELMGFTLGSVVEQRAISYRRLEEMNALYDSNYEKLKEDLNFPEAFDFSIVSLDLPDIVMQGVVPDTGEIVAQDYVEEVLFENGTMINARFTLKVW